MIASVKTLWHQLGLSEYLSQRCEQQTLLLSELNELSKQVSTAPTFQTILGIGFLIYIDDLPNIIETFIGLFADDTSLYAIENYLDKIAK